MSEARERPGTMKSARGTKRKMEPPPGLYHLDAPVKIAKSRSGKIDQAVPTGIRPKTRKGLVHFRGGPEKTKVRVRIPPTQKGAPRPLRTIATLIEELRQCQRSKCATKSMKTPFPARGPPSQNTGGAPPAPQCQVPRTREEKLRDAKTLYTPRGCVERFARALIEELELNLSRS